LLSLLTYPTWGKTFDRRPNPFWQRGLLYWLWSLPPLFYSAAAAAAGVWRLPLLYGAEMARGVTESGGGLNWTLGGIRFAPPGKAAVYNSIHLFNCGLRGVVGTIIGVLLYAFYRAWKQQDAAGALHFFTMAFFLLSLMTSAAAFWMMRLRHTYADRFHETRKMPDAKDSTA
jgi:hypothetical protein